jgi:hypothetical protein
MGTHQSFPVRNAQTKQRPFPRRGFCCPVGSSGTTAASDAHPAPAHFPAEAPVIGRASSDATAPQPPGRGGPPQFPPPPLRAFRAPYAGKSLGAANQALHPFRGLRPDNPGSALPRPRQRRDGSRHGRLRLTLRTARSLPQRGFRRWASTPGVSPQRRQPATGPPGSYPDRTPTGRQRRAYVGSGHLNQPPPTLGTRCFPMDARASSEPGSEDCRCSSEAGATAIRAIRPVFGCEAEAPRRWSAEARCRSSRNRVRRRAP